MEYFITAAGIPVHINESKKDGTAILLLHGYLETLYIWNEFQELFPADYRIISFDLPGHGLSGISSDGFNETFCIKFLNAVLEKLSVSTCHIITHSFSYHIAYSFSSFFPEKVLSIVNIGSSLAMTSEEISFINSIKKSLTDGSFMKYVSHSILNMYHNSNLRAYDEKIQETIEICETHDPDALISFFSGLSSFFSDSVKQSSISSVPTLHISGSENCLFNQIPDNFTLIPESGLNSFIEKPTVVYSILSSFLFENKLFTKGSY